MRIIIEKDYEQLSITTMDLLLKKMYEDKPMHIAITAGSTPKRLYELLVDKVKGKKQFSNVTYYNFDEIPFKGKEGYGVTVENLKSMYFDPAGISMDNVHVLDENNYKEHDALLASIGGLDTMLMGIGADGHFCGNLPGTTAFGDGTVEVVVDKIPGMREVLLGEVNGDESQVPDSYVTMGPKAVMASKELIMFANGKAKASIVKKAFFGPVTEDVPSSVLQLHPNLTLLLDEDAASEILNLL